MDHKKKSQRKYFGEQRKTATSKLFAVWAVFLGVDFFKTPSAYGAGTEPASIELLPNRQAVICSGAGDCASHALLEYLLGPAKCADADQHYVLIAPDGVYRVRAEPDLLRFGNGDWRQSTTPVEMGVCNTPLHHHPLPCRGALHAPVAGEAGMGFTEAD